MRLITHNMLRCNVKGVENGYPLLIEADKVDIITSDFDADTVVAVLKKIDFSALKSAATSLSMVEGIDSIESPIGEELLQDTSFLQRVHNLLFEVHVQEGSLVCPSSGRKFPVRDGIPNMLLHEDEV